MVPGLFLTLATDLHVLERFIFRMRVPFVISGTSLYGVS